MLGDTAVENREGRTQGDIASATPDMFDMNADRGRNFFVRRWHGEVPLRTLLWRDMVCVGTAVNLLATFAALMAASQGASTWIAAFIHFAPLPYNLFLFAAVDRTKPRSTMAIALALCWLVVVTIV